ALLLERCRLHIEIEGSEDRGKIEQRAGSTQRVSKDRSGRVIADGGISAEDRRLNTDVIKAVLIRRIDEALNKDLERRPVGLFNYLIDQRVFVLGRANEKNISPGNLR